MIRTRSAHQQGRYTHNHNNHHHNQHYQQQATKPQHQQKHSFRSTHNNSNNHHHNHKLHNNNELHQSMKIASVRQRQAHNYQQQQQQQQQGKKRFGVCNADEPWHKSLGACNADEAWRDDGDYHDDNEIGNGDKNADDEDGEETVSSASSLSSSFSSLYHPPPESMPLAAALLLLDSPRCYADDDVDDDDDDDDDDDNEEKDDAVKVTVDDDDGDNRGDPLKGGLSSDPGKGGDSATGDGFSYANAAAMSATSTTIATAGPICVGGGVVASVLASKDEGEEEEREEFDKEYLDEDVEDEGEEYVYLLPRQWVQNWILWAAHQPVPGIERSRVRKALRAAATLHHLDAPSCCCPEIDYDCALLSPQPQPSKSVSSSWHDDDDDHDKNDGDGEAPVLPNTTMGSFSVNSSYSYTSSSSTLLNVNGNSKNGGNGSGQGGNGIVGQLTLFRDPGPIDATPLSLVGHPLLLRPNVVVGKGSRAGDNGGDLGSGNGSSGTTAGDEEDVVGCVAVSETFYNFIRSIHGVRCSASEGNGGGKKGGGGRAAASPACGVSFQASHHAASSAKNNVDGGGTSSVVLHHHIFRGVDENIEQSNGKHCHSNQGGSPGRRQNASSLRNPPPTPIEFRRRALSCKTRQRTTTSTMKNKKKEKTSMVTTTKLTKMKEVETYPVKFAYTIVCNIPPGASPSLLATQPMNHHNKILRDAAQQMNRQHGGGGGGGGGGDHDGHTTGKSNEYASPSRSGGKYQSSVSFSPSSLSRTNKNKGPKSPSLLLSPTFPPSGGLGCGGGNGTGVGVGSGGGSEIVQYGFTLISKSTSMREAVRALSRTAAPDRSAGRVRCWIKRSLPVGNEDDNCKNKKREEARSPPRIPGDNSNGGDHDDLVRIENLNRRRVTGTALGDGYELWDDMESTAYVKTKKNKSKLSIVNRQRQQQQQLQLRSRNQRQEKGEEEMELTVGEWMERHCFRSLDKQGKVEGEESVLEFVVETRTGPNAAWVRKHLTLGERIQVGDFVDAQDTAGQWYEAVVREVHASTVKVHYAGWGSRWDAVVPRFPPPPSSAGTNGKQKQSNHQSKKGGRPEKKKPDPPAPLWSRTSLWRHSIQVGDEVEVRESCSPVQRPKWYRAVIRAVGNESDSIRDIVGGASLEAYDDYPPRVPPHDFDNNHRQHEYGNGKNGGGKHHYGNGRNSGGGHSPRRSTVTKNGRQHRREEQREKVPLMLLYRKRQVLVEVPQENNLISITTTLSISSSSTTTNEDNNNSDAMNNNDNTPESNPPVVRWVNLYGEEICKQCTHNPPPPPRPPQPAPTPQSKLLLTSIQQQQLSEQQQQEQQQLLIVDTNMNNSASSPIGKTPATIQYDHNPQREPVEVLRSHNNIHGAGFVRESIRGVPPAPGSVGFQNLGNSCFLNSIVQCLNHIDALTKYFLSGDYVLDLNKENPLGSGGSVAISYANLLQDVWGGSYSTVAPRSLKLTVAQFAPQFNNCYQHDSQEFCSFLMDGLHEDLNRVHDKPYVEDLEGYGLSDKTVSIESWKKHLLRHDSIIVDNCQGMHRSHLTCPECGHESVKFDVYSTISLSIPVENTNKKTSKKKGEQQHPEASSSLSSTTIPLSTCLEKFTSIEQLDDKNAWYCNKCKKHVCARKLIQLWTTPDILILHLNRFQFDNCSKVQGRILKSKVEDKVEFPVDGLDMRPYILGPVDDKAPPIYKLFGVSEHSGPTANSGHYTATVRNSKDGKWYRYNDSQVGLSSGEAAITGGAYVLFYQRTKGTSKWAGMEKLIREKEENPYCSTSGSNGSGLLVDDDGFQEVKSKRKKKRGH